MYDSKEKKPVKMRDEKKNHKIRFYFESYLYGKHIFLKMVGVRIRALFIFE